MELSSFPDCLRNHRQQQDHSEHRQQPDDSRRLPSEVSAPGAQQAVRMRLRVAGCAEGLLQPELPSCLGNSTILHADESCAGSTSRFCTGSSAGSLGFLREVFVFPC